MAELMTRTDFRTKTFLRDKYQCVVCHAPAVDAHHLLERKLWNDGGYYLNNSVSLCEQHHLDAERTLISVEELREYAGIATVIVPRGFDTKQQYDKWGNPIMGETRKQGPLFHDTGCQKALRDGHVYW